jgi:MtrB/PioB family decaheme-associated outer membrane protein
MTRAIALILALGLAAPAVAGDDPPAEPGKVEATPADATQVDIKRETAPINPAPVPEPPSETDVALVPPGTRFAVRNVVMGVGGRSEETTSAKFMEYRSFPNGAVLPFLRFFGEDKVRYDMSARNALQDDAWYGVRLGYDWFGLEGQFVKMPHVFGNQAVSVLQDMGNGEFRVPDALQQQYQTAIQDAYTRNRNSVNFAFLSGLANGLVAGTERSRIGLQRDRGNLEMSFTRDKPVDVRMTYMFEKRTGGRGSGTAFGFGNVVETAEPIDYRTHDVALNAEWVQKWGLLRGGLRLNRFDNRIPVQTFDNPFRFTDSNDASAYQAPGAQSIAGAAVGRLALPPSSDSITGTLGFAVKFAGNSRLTADAAYGQWTQDEPFIAFTSNTSITSPFRATDVSHLPAPSLDGRIDTMSLSALLSSRPVKGVNLTARYRRYDVDNKTPRIAFPEGYVRFDAVWEDIPRISVPYGYTNDNGQLTAAYDFDLGEARVGLEAGLKMDRMERTFREAAHTFQNTVFGSLNLRTSDWMVLRGTVEVGQRDYEELEIELSEEASFLEVGVPANLLAVPGHSLDPAMQKVFASLGCANGLACNVRYDQAQKDLWRATGMLQLTPGGSTSLSLSYTFGKDDFTESRYGLVESKNWAFNAEAGYTPSERLSAFAFYGREDIRSFQRGRQSGGTVSFNPLDDWTADMKDIVDTFGGGLTLGVVKDKADLSLFGSYQKIDGNNAIAAPVGGAPEVAKRPLGGVLGIAEYDDTKLLSMSGELAYKVSTAWTVTLGGVFEDYTMKDALSTGLAYYMPASFFLAGNDGDYRAGAMYLRLAYLW